MIVNKITVEVTCSFSMEEQDLFTCVFEAVKTQRNIASVKLVNPENDMITLLEDEEHAFDSYFTGEHAVEAIVEELEKRKTANRWNGIMKGVGK